MLAESSAHNGLRATKHVLFLCLIAAHTWAAFADDQGSQAVKNDIIVVSTPKAPSKASDGSDLTIYSSQGKLKKSIHLNFWPGETTIALGLSGNAQFAFLGSSISQFGDPYLPNSKRGQLAVVQIAGGPLQYLGTFNGGRDLQLSRTNVIASGSKSGSIFVGESVKCKDSDAITDKVKATNIVELQFTQGKGGQASLKRLRTFEAYRSGSEKCSEPAYSQLNVVLAMRTIGNKLFAIVSETPESYTLRSFDTSSVKPQRSDPIVTYSKSTLTAFTIDSPTSFIAQGQKPGPYGGLSSTKINIRVAKGKDPTFGIPAPGIGNNYSPQVYFGGMSSFAGSKGILAATGTLSDKGYGPIGNSIYSFDSSSLAGARKLLTLNPAAMCEDIAVVP